jgi:hypothetical protein
MHPVYSLNRANLSQAQKYLSFFFNPNVHLIIQLYFDSYENISSNTYQRGRIVFKEDMCRFSKNND